MKEVYKGISGSQLGYLLHQSRVQELECFPASNLPATKKRGAWVLSPAVKKSVRVCLLDGEERVLRASRWQRKLCQRASRWERAKDSQGGQRVRAIQARLCISSVLGVSSSHPIHVSVWEKAKSFLLLHCSTLSYQLRVSLFSSLFWDTSPAIIILYSPKYSFITSEFVNLWTLISLLKWICK